MTYPLLNKVRIIESSAFIAAPLAGLTLSQYGADVIRIDMIGGGIDYGRMPRVPHPHGKGRSLYWTALNKGKRSIALDIRRPEGRELIQALVTAPGEDAGVLLTNIGTPWLKHEVLAERRSDVITCTIQGNGDGSTAVDYTVNTVTGYPLVTGGGSKSNPVNHVLPAWDVACAHHAAFAVVAAINRRLRFGEGSDIKLALSDIAFSTLSHLGVLADAELLDEERPSIGNYLYGAFGRDFVTSDGDRLMVVAISSGQWRALVKACDLTPHIERIESETGTDLSDEAARFDAREQIAAVLDIWFQARTKHDIVRRFQECNVTFSPYLSVQELIKTDPRVSTANPIFQRVATPGVGEHLSAGAAARLGGLEREPEQGAPLLGTHTDQILSEVLGLDGGAIGKLHDAGIVAGPGSDPTLV